MISSSMMLRLRPRKRTRPQRMCRRKRGPVDTRGFLAGAAIFGAFGGFAALRAFGGFGGFGSFTAFTRGAATGFGSCGVATRVAEIRGADTRGATFRRPRARP